MAKNYLFSTPEWQLFVQLASQNDKPAVVAIAAI
jgi:hypothetical protein